MFWPELPEARARHGLRQAIHDFRRTLGQSVIANRGEAEVAVAKDALWCDVLEFEKALESGRDERALELYRADFLEGLNVSTGSSSFERWLDDERARLRAAAAQAAWTLSSAAESARDTETGRRRARQAAGFARDDEASQRRLIATLDRLGDRAGALRAYDEFARMLRAELDAEPSAETKAVVAAVRERTRPRGAYERPAPHAQESGALDVPAVLTVREDDTPAGSRPDTFHGTAPTINPERWRWNRAVRVASAVIVCLVIALALYGSTRLRREAATAIPTIAVGRIVEEGQLRGDSLYDAGTVRELLATGLARVSGLSVVSQERMYDLLAQTGKTIESEGALEDVARLAGATEIIEGVLYRRNDSAAAFRVDLRGADLRTGVVTRAYTASGADIFALIDSVTQQFASSLGLAGPTHALARATSTSLVARRLYEQGLRHYYRGEPDAAARLFMSALAEDSTHGMAARLAARTTSGADAIRATSLLANAARQASRLPERERLLIRYSWTSEINEPVALSLAESLAVRFPNEPEGHRALGGALSWAGDFLRSVPHLEKAIVLDSLCFARAELKSACHPWEALAVMVASFVAADSLTAAERTARRWIRLQPSSASPRMALAEVLASSGRRAEALAALDSAARISPSLARDSWMELRLALRAGDFAAVDRYLDARLSDSDPAVRSETIWWRTIVLRNRGRLAGADSISAAFCASADREVGSSRGDPTCRLARGPVLYEASRYREAARLYESIAASPVSRGIPVSVADARPVLARHRSWMLTHAADAYMGAGDITSASRLADSVERWGQLSAYGRDRRLHHHIRGLIAGASGRRADAIASYRRAIYSLSQGYTRTNLELGRELIAAGRYDEAIAVLRPALRGPIQASNLYVTLTEIHEQLAIAFSRAGRADSAAVHNRWVANAWREGDAPFRERARRAENAVRLNR